MHISDFCCTFASAKVFKQRKEAIMLGFSSSRGEIVKGLFAEELRDSLLRAKTGNLTENDRARIAFENQAL